MAKVISLVLSEPVRLEPDRIGGLYRQLGDASAEDVICRAIEELAVRLSHCERLKRQDDIPQFRKSARSLVAIAEQIGMTALARVAADVTDAVDAQDNVALDATFRRLQRIGERSLTAVWDLQDLSV